MRYTAMIVGFLLATLTAVGAAEPERPGPVTFTLDDLVKTKSFYGAVRDWIGVDHVQIQSSALDRTAGVEP